MTDSRSDGSIDVIVAARNAAADLAACLAALRAQRDRGEIARIIVIDDASDDATGAQARRSGADIVARLSPRAGAAGARNAGAAHARAEVLWFVDADVVVHDDAARRLRQAFATSDAEAVFGSYGDRPHAPNFLSQYKNLIHHDVHQRAAGAVETFWTGCGGVRADAFDRIQGFDALRHARRGMEDIDFGYRLRAAGGSIRLEPKLLCEHRKRWQLGNLLYVEIFHRALPWARMMLARTDGDTSLNVGPAERLRAVIAGAATLVLTGTAAGLWSWPWALVALGGVLVANARLIGFFSKKRGPGFALRAVAFHQLYYLYSGTTFVYAWLEHQVRRIQHRLKRDRLV